MRCINCGYDNSKDRTVCLKCGQSLHIPKCSTNQSNTVIGENVYTNNPTERIVTPKPTVLNVNKPVSNEITERKTLIMNPTNIGSQALSSLPSQSPVKCPSCDYPIVGQYENCPYCGVSLKAEAIKKEKTILTEVQMSNDIFVCQHCQKEISTISNYCPHCGERIHLPTIIPSKKKESLPRCSLTIIPEENESIDSIKLRYEGNSIVLNRFNTEEKNRTITTKEQAILSNEKGNWYLENHSPLQTTYLVLNRKIKLEEGDIIILGDRKFKFKEE